MAHQPTTLTGEATPRQLIVQIGVATLGRLVNNTARRFVYPFAPALSRGLDVPLPAITSLIALNQGTGLLSPVFGPLGDRWGYRSMMLIALGMLAVGMLAGGLLPFYGAVFAALTLAGLAKSIFDPTLQAYIGARVPYQRRGMAIGFAESAWALSSLVGVPLAGFLIDNLGWQAPFVVLGGLAIFSAVALAIFVPAHRPQQTHSVARPSFAEIWQQLRHNPAALWGLGFAFFISVGNDNLFVVLGLWLESFGLSLTAIGVAASVIGMAELIGELLTASVADRLGLRRSLLIGLSLVAISYLLLPLLGLTLALALLALFLVFLFFEFTIVTALSFFTEVSPGARATMMSALAAAFGLGRMAGAFLGGFAWANGGLLAVSLISTVMTIAGLACLWWGTRS